MRIREAKREDVPAIHSIVLRDAEYHKATKEVELTADEMERLGFGERPMFGAFVLEDDAQTIVGAAIYFFKFSTWKGRSLYLADIYLENDYRGNGYGKDLFMAVVQMAYKEKVRKLEWQVADWNSQAIGFYRKLQADISNCWYTCKLSDAQMRDLLSLNEED